MKRVIQYLDEQGIKHINEGGFLSFRYHEINFLYLKDERDEDFYSMYVPGIWKVDNASKFRVLEVINGINNQLKIVKMVVNGDYVWAGIEQNFIAGADWDEMMTYSIDILCLAYHLFHDRWSQAVALN